MTDTHIRHLAVGEDVFPYTDVGAGTPILFLHGALCDLRTWRRQSEALAGRFRFIAYTQRWFGDTAWRADGPRFGMGAHADDLIAVCETLGAGPVALVAWSYAGHPALAAALRRPDLFSRVLVYEPGVPSYVTDAEELDAFGRDAGAMFGPVFEASGRGEQEEAVRRLIDGSGGHAGYFDGQSEERRRIALENAHSMPALLAQEPPPHITGEELGSLRVPVSVVWGAATRPVFAVPSRGAARCIVSGAHREVPDVGHMWPDEDPAGFAALVAAWMDA